MKKHYFNIHFQNIIIDKKWIQWLSPVISKISIFQLIYNNNINVNKLEFRRP